MTAPASGPVPELSPDDRQRLLDVARRTLGDFLENGRLPEWRADSPALLEPRATFVTLWQRVTQELRGCRGEPFGRRPLIESVATMVIASATDDPRFPAVTVEEVPGLRIEISALTPIAPIRPAEIEVGRHGLLIVRGPHAGLLLPEVPVRQGWGTEDFLDALCEKAGLPQSIWKAPGTELYGFEAEVWSEEE